MTATASNEPSTDRTPTALAPTFASPAAKPPVAPLPIDLQRIADDTDWGFAIEHVARYLERATQWVLEARDTCARGDLHESARLIHQIRGGAMHMPELLETSTRALHIARAGQVQALAPAIDELESAVARVLDGYTQAVAERHARLQQL